MKISRRALILILSVVIIGLTFAGLQGILNLLAERGPLDNSAAQSQPVTFNGQVIPTRTVASGPAESDSGLDLEFPFDISQLSGLSSVTPSLDIPAEGGLPPHVPLFKLSGGLGSSYLRTSAASLYQNNGWQYDNSLPAESYTGQKLDYSLEGYSRKSLNNISIEPLAGFASSPMPIPAAQYVNKLDSDFPVAFDAGNQVFISSSGLPDAYSFEALNYVFEEEDLAQDKAASDPDYLELPPEISDRTLELAQEITAGIDSPYLQAAAIEDYLEENYNYSFDYTPAPSNAEPNDWFLFEEKQGVCSNFNSAFVVLSRASGIPARMVSGYAVDPQKASQTVYADQAHAWSEIELDRAGWITFDATGTNQNALIETVTTIVEVSPVVEKDTPFTVNGTVTSSVVVDGTLVELYINTTKSLQNAVLIGQSIVTAGFFEVTATVPADSRVGNYQLIARSSQTPRFAESTSDPVIKVMARTDLSLASVPRIKTGQALTINGQLLENTSLAVSGQTVVINVNEQRLTEVVTDSAGRFEYKSIFNQPGQYDMTAEFPGAEFFYGSAQNASFQVLTPTTLTIQPSDRLRAGQVLSLTGRLTDSLEMQPVADQTVELWMDSELTGVTARTAADGSFEMEYRIKNAGIHEIEVKYISQPYYWDSSARAALEVTASGSRTLIGMLLMISSALIAAGYAVLRYLRKHRPGFTLWKRKTAPPAAVEAAAGDEASPAEDETAAAAADAPDPTARLEIEFPGIVNPLPDVWGIDDDFDVACRLRDIQGGPLAGKEIEILMGSPITTLTTDPEGKSSVTLAFSEKGTFDIEAIYHPQNPSEPIVQSLRSVRIVEYREEIIAAYRELLEWFRQKDILISEDNTPREVENLITVSGLPVPPEALENFISVFEEATYSLHPITRRHFVKMHFAQEEIREYESPAEQSPD